MPSLTVAVNSPNNAAQMGAKALKAKLEKEQKPKPRPEGSK